MTNLSPRIARTVAMSELTPAQRTVLDLMDGGSYIQVNNNYTYIIQRPADQPQFHKSRRVTHKTLDALRNRDLIKVIQPYPEAEHPYQRCIKRWVTTKDDPIWKNKR